MSDPKRLLDDVGSDDFERAVLSSALPDRGSNRAFERTLASIAAGAAVTAVAAPVGASVVLKWLGIGALAGLVTAGSVDYALHRPEPSAPPTIVDSPSQTRAEAPALAPEKPLAPGPEPTALTPERPRAIGSQSAPEVETPATGPSVGSLPAPLSSSERLLREVRALDRAKSALASGNASGALAALDEHAREFPAGALGPEAEVLRVRALVATGNRSSALVIARRIVQRQPNGDHAKVMKSLLPELGSNP
jgi:hypothetical protein